MINRDDWLTAVRAANEVPLPETDALTMRELTDLFGVGRPAAQRRVDQLVKIGAAEPTTKLMRMNNGGLRTVPAYRLLPKTRPMERSGRCASAIKRKRAR